MVYCLGTPSEVKDIEHQLEEKCVVLNPGDWTNGDDLNTPDLFVIFPSAETPINFVRDIARKYPVVSIIVFTTEKRHNQIKQSLLFSLQVGKNTSCIIYNPSVNYSEVFQNAILRTRQRRSFSKFNAAAEAQLAHFTSPLVKLHGVGDILEHAPIGAILLNTELMIIGANRAAREMFSRLQDKQRTLKSIFPNHFHEIINLVKRGGVGESVIVDDQQGHFFDLRTFTISHHDADQNILLFNDITETREKNRRITAILESLPLIAWTADPDGNSNYYNQGWYNYTRTEESTAMDNGWAEVVHRDDLQIVTSKWKSCTSSGTAYEQACRLRRSDGVYKWHLAKASPIRTKAGEIEMWVGTAMDIHDQVLLSENLERKVKERTKLLEETNAELEQFAHISSHDLQEPLRKIQTFAHVIKDDDFESLSENSKRYLGKIILTSERMTKLLKDLLKFTKISQQEPESIIDLNQVIQHIREDLELSMQQHQVSLSVSQLPTIEGRPLQIKQLFYNIISNSIKYRTPDLLPTVAITCNKFERNSLVKELPARSYWEIVVKDNGIGFDQQYAEQIFTVFQRLHTRAAYEGTGIGLAIARKVVANHKGAIFAISSPGNGAEFHIILPAMAESSQGL